MNMMKKVLVMALAASGLGAACAATTVSATTPEFRLSIKHDGVRASAGEESLRYSNLWDGNADATVTISQDGTPLATGLTGEGEQAWSVARNGTYALTHTTYTNGIVAKVENATFVVTGKDVPVGELTIDWGESTFVYDGTPKCPVVTVKSGAETLTKDTDYAVSYLDNVNVGTARVIVDGLDLYVGSRTNTFTITKASMGGGGEGGGTGGEEPGSGTVPAGGLSKFDTSFVYDGKGHAIATNELVAAFAARLGAEPFAVSYVAGETGEGLPAEGWSAVAPAYTNAGEYVVWYRVTSANYEDFVHAAKVMVTKRAMSAVSVSEQGVFDYTGAAIVPSVTVSDGSPSIVKESDYTVSYADNVQPGTARIILVATAGGNYTGTKTVTFTIRKAPFDIDDGTGGEGGAASSFSYAGVYDGKGHGIDVQIANPPAGTVIKYSCGQPDKAPGGTWSMVKPLYTNVCENVVWYAVESAGYVAYTNNATVTVTPKPLTVRADAKDKAFGTADPALTYVASGLLGTDALTGALAREPGETVGTYDIQQGTLAAGPNYALEFTGATFTIGQAPAVGPFGPAESDIDPETGLVVVRLLGDQGPIEMPDNLGPFILDINGNSVTGVCGSAESGVYDGGPAIVFTHVDGGEGTSVIICNSDPEGRGGIFGGDGASGTAAHPAGGNGGPGIRIEDTAVAPSVTIEENVLVRGGRGGDGYAGSGADGANGGAGIEDRTTEPDDSTIVNGGTIEGGRGGDGADGTGDTPGGNGGNGGAGVDGNVDENTGTITGGDGGSGGGSESGNGGNGGSGGVGVGGNVSDDTGTIVDGEDGATMLTASMVSLAEGPWSYTGSSVTPTVVVTVGNVELVEGDDFTVSYQNNVNAGTATVVVTGLGGYDGAAMQTFAILPRSVTVTVVGHVATNVYDAVAHTVSGYEIETEDELYDIAADTTFAGAASVSGTDAGTYAMNLAADQFTNGNANFEVTYAVTDGHLVVKAADITADEAADFVLTLGANPTYNGTVQAIPVTAVTYKGLPVSYTLAGENATHAGTYTLTVKANGNFAGEKSTTWQILKRQVTLTSGSATRVYDATPLKNAAVSVSGDGFIGLEGATYTVTGAQTDVGSSKNAFTYTLKAGTLAGDYTITTVQGALSVTPRAVTLLSASASKVYDGTPLVMDAVSVKPGSLGFAGAEGFAAICSGTITAVGTTSNTFTYTLTNGAKAGNYTITTEYGTLAVTKATLDAGSVFPGLETWTEDDGFACTRVYNGKAQSFEVAVAEDFAEEYEFLYALTPGAWSPVAPTRTTVAEGPVKVYFKFLSPNFEPYEGYGTLRIVEKEIADEMVQPGEDAFFFDGDAKKPTVDVIHEVDGQDICKESDYTLVYGEKADTGWWVTVTGKGNYSGTVTKIVPVLKRPVAPPIVPPKSYNGKTQKPTIPTDSRWAVVANPGGIDVGEYTNVVLRLTDTANYKWKGGTEEATDITLVFAITKANNGWSRYPAMAGWEYGQTPSEPNLGQARYGTVRVAYRKAGTDVSTETATRPELPGQYIARFYVEALANYIGVTRDVAFEITGTAPGGDHTTTTPVPVPYVWLDPYLATFGGGSDYEKAGHATGANGVALWESYVAGLDPTDPTSRFMAKIKMNADNEPIVSWAPALNGETPAGEGILKGERVYRIHGKANLEDTTWTPDIDPKSGEYRFYKITVELMR